MYNTPPLEDNKAEDNTVEDNLVEDSKVARLLEHSIFFYGTFSFQYLVMFLLSLDF
jgi:hypothetical protein